MPRGEGVVDVVEQAVEGGADLTDLGAGVGVDPVSYTHLTLPTSDLA